jgi:hypothetical protein
MAIQKKRLLINLPEFLFSVQRSQIMFKLKYISNFSHVEIFLFGQGSWSLKNHEKIVLDAALNALEPNIRSIMEKQLSQDYFVDRISPGKRIVTFRFYEKDKSLIINDKEYSDLLLKVEIIIDGKKQTAHATFYNGYIYGLEFKKPYKFYKDKEINVGGVKIGKSGDTYTRVIDRAEHGKETDYNP